MKREEHIEHEVRKRIAEALTQQGMGQARISLEVLYMLPPEFLDAYSELYNRALRLDSSVNIGDPDALPVKNRPGKRGPAKPAKKYRTHWQIADDKAFARKKKVDRELKKLIPKIRSDREDNRHRTRCGGCGRWCEARWNNCAWCGESLGS